MVNAWSLLTFPILVFHVRSEDNKRLKEYQECAQWGGFLDSNGIKYTESSYAANFLSSDCPRVRKTRGLYVHYDQQSGFLYTLPEAVEICRLIRALEERKIIIKPKKDHLFIDIGAAFGSEIALGHFLGYSVIAFEARRDEYMRIQKHFGHLSNVTIFQAAASNIDGNISLYMASDSSSIVKSAVTSGKEAVKFNKANSKILSVPAVQLDTILFNAAFYNQRVAFLKIDVQGAEFNVLRGAINILRRDSPILYFEYAPYLIGENAPAIFCFLRELDLYHCSQFSTITAICVPKHFTALLLPPTNVT
mmetsp:Transcript_16787/g.25240  ORF Transcript_16787/g.25240 Transcript_16787/m.25240 type:complete len:306 (-) Transcript_16787:409-1326(-)